MLLLCSLWLEARCLGIPPNGLWWDAWISLPMVVQWLDITLNGGAMLGYRARWLAVRCLDIAPDGWQHNAWISCPMAGSVMRRYHA
jgi:hypothetical protein